MRDIPLMLLNKIGNLFGVSRERSPRELIMNDAALIMTIRSDSHFQRPILATRSFGRRQRSQ